MPSRPRARLQGARATPLSTSLVGKTGGSRLARRGEYAYLIGEDYPDGRVWPATEAEAMAMPPFGRGIALLANAVASTDWHAQRFDPALGVSVRIPDQPRVVLDPDPNVTPWAYRWAATEDLVLYGNHFALPAERLVGTDPERWSFIDDRTMRWGALYPLPADDVWILIKPGNELEPASWAFNVAGVEVSPLEMFHVSAGNRSGEVMGRGVLRQYAESLGQYVAAETHAGNYFAGGTLPPAVLQSPTVVEQAQADELKAKWREMTSTREPVILPMGYLLTPVVSNAEQSQLVESRTWNANLVAMLLGIPPWKLGLAGPTMTYSNIETADIDFIRDSADRYGRPLVESFTKWLMPAGTTVVFDYADRMRADQRTTADVLTAYVGAGIITDDEARAVIGRPPLARTDEPDGTTPEGVPELTPSDVN